MGAYNYLQALWCKKQSDVMRFVLRLRTWEYRQLPCLVRVNVPSRPDKAARLGYRERAGFVVYRVRIARGDRKRQARKGVVCGKTVNTYVMKKKSKENLRARAEKRAGKRLGGLRLLNSYWVGQDGSYKYFECIFVDAALPSIREDPKINWICKSGMAHREARGLTSAGRKHRGLHKKGHNSPFAQRPSIHGGWKRVNRVHLHRYR